MSFERMPELPRGNKASPPIPLRTYDQLVAVPWGEPRDDKALMTGKLWEWISQ